MDFWTDFVEEGRSVLYEVNKVNLTFFIVNVVNRRHSKRDDARWCAAVT